MQLNCTAWVEALNTRGDRREKHRVSVKNIGLCSRMASMFNKYWSPFVRCFVYNNPEDVMHSLNHTEHYRQQLYYLIIKKRDSISAEFICNFKEGYWSHEGTIDFPQDKPLTSSTTNFSVSSSAHFIGGWVDLRSGLDFGQDKNLLYVSGLKISFSRPVGSLIITSTTLPRLRMIHGMVDNLKILSKWKRGKQTRMQEINAASRNKMVTATNFVSYFREIFKRYLPASTWE
jgi:hypothetical protein